MASTTFEPRWASAPGSTIVEALQARNLTVEDLADRLELSDPDARRLLSGEISIDNELANGIASIAGGTASFWVSRDQQYRESRSLLSAEELVERLPFKQMTEWGWVGPADSWRERAARTLEYFGVRDGSEWNALFRERIKQAHYRASPSIQSSEASVAAWLRQVEIQTRTKPDLTWRPELLNPCIARIRAASRLSRVPAVLDELADALADLGVKFLIVKAPKDCALSGAATVSANGQRVIAITARHLSDDHLFFTVLHELGHHTLHGDSLFLDEFEDADTPQIEAEADDFASTALIPAGVDALVGRANGPTMRTVVAFASHHGVAPGIVVGQLQHSGVLRYNQLNALKRRFAWDGLSLKSARRQ